VADNLRYPVDLKEAVPDGTASDKKGIILICLFCYE